MAALFRPISQFPSLHGLSSSVLRPTYLLYGSSPSLCHISFSLGIMNPSKPIYRYLLVAGLLVAAVFFLHRSGTTTADVLGVIRQGDLSTTSNTPDLLPLEEAKHYCQTRRWEPFPDRDKQRKVYDLFMINTELDWMEVRIGELASEVDYFVVLESEVDFKDRPKPLYVQENWHRFAKWHHQIIHHVLNTTDNPVAPNDEPWGREHFSRNSMLTQVFPTLSGPSQPHMGDVILVSDVDEIPRPEVIKSLRNCQFPQRLTLRTTYYRYSFQWLLREEEWIHPQATFWKGNETVHPEALRMGKHDGEILHAGWHCSSCLSSFKEMAKKIDSFSHNELNQPKFKNPKNMLRRVREGRDPYDRKDKTYDRIDGNRDIPQYVVNHPKEFAYLLDRDPPSANFKDYDPKDFV